MNEIIRPETDLDRLVAGVIRRHDDELDAMFYATMSQRLFDRAFELGRQMAIRRELLCLAILSGTTEDETGRSRYSHGNNLERHNGSARGDDAAPRVRRLP